MISRWITVHILVLVAIGGEAISCSYMELVSVNPPKGLTCDKYMGPFMQFAGGYLTNPDAAEDCQYCPYATTDQYMLSRFNIACSNHWRNLGIVFGFVAFNVRHCRMLLGSRAHITSVDHRCFLVHIFHAHSHCWCVCFSEAEVDLWQVDCDTSWMYSKDYSNE